MPRTITSWFPRREPYELKSLRSTPCSTRYRPAGDSGLIEPAGEMWSVVTESPSETRQRASWMSSTVPASAAMPSKYGGCRTYVDASSQAKTEPSGTGSSRHSGSPV